MQKMLQQQPKVKPAPARNERNYIEYDLSDHVRIALHLALKEERPLLAHLLEMALLETDDVN